MVLNNIIKGGSLALVLLCGLNAQAAVLTFEDLHPGYETTDILPDGYEGFSWGNSAGIVTSDYLPGTGYQNGVLDTVGLYNRFGEDLAIARDVPFTLASAYITSAWNLNQGLLVEGWNNGSLLYSSTINTSFHTPTNYTFNFVNIDKVNFRPFANGINAGLGGDGPHFVIDNIHYGPVSPVPEPTTWMLLTGGLIALGLRRRFKDS